MKKLPPLFLIYFICFSVSHDVPGIIPLLPTFQQEFALNSYEVANCLAYFSYSVLIATPFMGYFYNNVPKKFSFIVSIAFILPELQVFLFLRNFLTCSYSELSKA